jgi:hypothetical protein
VRTRHRVLHFDDRTQHQIAKSDDPDASTERCKVAHARALTRSRCRGDRAFGIRPRFEFRHDAEIRAKEAAPEFRDLS